MWRERIASLDRGKSGELGHNRRNVCSIHPVGNPNCLGYSSQRSEVTSLSFMAGVYGFITDEQCDD